MSGTGPEVLLGSNQRPERVSIASHYFLQERTHLRPATLSSWLKQTILLCYKQADQQSLDLVQVKAHDIRAFAVSKAFYGGVLVDQIMQACHWNAHNTFTNMSTPLGGGHIIFAFSAVRRPTWFPDILGNSSYPIFTKFGMQVYWVNSL